MFVVFYVLFLLPEPCIEEYGGTLNAIINIILSNKNINNFKNIGHEACQTDESGKFLIVEVYLEIH